MNWNTIQTIAGLLSSSIFMAGIVSMLLKTWHTKDVHSYSLASIILNVTGNMIHWLYILSLPFGPIYLLHGFYTIAMLLMLFWYLLYRRYPITARRITRTFKRVTTPGMRSSNPSIDIRQTQEITPVQN